MTNAEREKALHTIVAAFATEPLVRWIVLHADKYSTCGVRMFEVFGGAAFAAGTAYETGGFTGAAPWVSSGHEDESADEAFGQI